MKHPLRRTGPSLATKRRVRSHREAWNRNLNTPQRQPSHRRRRCNQRGPDPIRQSAPTTDEPSQQQARYLTHAAEGVQRPNARIPFLLRTDFQYEHVRHSIRCGEASPESRRENDFDRQAELRRHQRQRR